MHRALTIPEVLDIIFSSTDELANARSVSVCKTWSGVALDTLWRDVSGLRRLFGLLASVNEYGRFTRPIESSGWSKFNAIAFRVKRLAVDDMDGPKFHETALGKVATMRQTFHLLPNLVQLTLTTKNEDEFWFSVIFLHQNLQSLILKIPDKVPPKRIFTEVSLRAAKLCTLVLQSSNPIRKYEADLTDMFSTLRNLQTVVMPCYSITSSIMASLACLPNLDSLQSEQFTDRRSEDPADVQPFCPMLLDGAFPSLTDLSCDSTLCDISSFFMAKFAPANITSLYVQTASIETPSSFSQCLKALFSTCKMLQSLNLCLLIDGSEENLIGNSDSISFKDLCPILDFPCLTSFELAHYRLLDITDDDVDHLARNWPSLKCLNLNSDPVVLDDPKISFASFSSLARHCPNLDHLGLYLNPSPDHIPKPAVPFKMLTSLQFGTSPIQSEDHAALYLSEVCPPSCEIEVGATWNKVLMRDITGNADSAGELRRRWAGWERVQDILPLLTKLRHEERERSQHLEKEVQDLRAQVKSLKDSKLTRAAQDAVMTDVVQGLAYI
ncbi:hypothetical protein BD410DRAFT_767699 [Rickenella mellea]|uniref:F-box domain-containing protein n=1 Tax=Rickenella mellea TaxID=50990 RepID=A0A4Y7Q8F0_9AGAM|nr:hypothetical protein BD410DRAFT_767699 [Rickenella mellea]